MRRSRTRSPSSTWRSSSACCAAATPSVAATVDPALRVYDVMALDAVGADRWLESQYMSRLLTVLSGLTLLLSLTAIYAVVAFTVVQRTREYRDAPRAGR